MMQDEEMSGGAAEETNDANFCATCGNGITSEGKCAPCGQEPDQCTCTGNEEGSHGTPSASDEAVM